MPTDHTHHIPEVAPEAKPAGTSRRGALGAALAGAGALGDLARSPAAPLTPTHRLLRALPRPL